MVDKSAPIQRLVVVGDGLVAAGAALTLARLLGTTGLRVLWVRPVGTEAPGVEVAHPPFVRWLEMVGVKEFEVLVAARGLYTLGVRYRTEANEFFLPHGSHGISPSPAPFEQEFFRRFSGKDQLAFHEHFLATRAALQGRFDFPVADPRSVKSTLRYGMHLEREGLVDLLTRQALAAGVERIDCRTLAVEQDEHQWITALRPDDGEPVQGDFFIDATGREAELIGKAMGESSEFTDGFRYARHTRVESAAPSWLPYGNVTSEREGWRRRVGLRDRVVVDDWRLPTSESEESHSGCRPVRREQSWVNNCLALGSAAGEPGDLVLSEWHWSCRCLLLWLELLPGRNERPHLRDEFNRRYREMFGAVAELETLHALSAAHVRSWPETIEWSVAHFRAFGRRWRRDEEPLADETWVALALGLGWYPETSDVMLADSDPEALRRKHQRIMQALEQAVQAMPSLETVMKDWIDNDER